MNVYYGMQTVLTFSLVSLGPYLCGLLVTDGLETVALLPVEGHSGLKPERNAEWDPSVFPSFLHQSSVSSHCSI